MAHPASVHDQSISSHLYIHSLNIRMFMMMRYCGPNPSLIQCTGAISDSRASSSLVRWKREDDSKLNDALELERWNKSFNKELLELAWSTITKSGVRFLFGMGDTPQRSSAKAGSSVRMSKFCQMYAACTPITL